MGSRDLYARYKLYIIRYPTNTVAGNSRLGMSRAGYVGYYTYIGIYPEGTGICSAPFTTLLSSYFGGRGRPRAVLWVAAHFIISSVQGQLSVHSPVDRTVHSPRRDAR